MSIENKINWLPFYTKSAREAIQLLNKPQVNLSEHDEEELIQMPLQKEGINRFDKFHEKHKSNIIDWEWYANDMRKLKEARLVRAEQKRPFWGIVYFSAGMILATTFMMHKK
jgi:hypothetical protein